MHRYPFERYLVEAGLSIREGLQRIEETERRTVFLVDSERRLEGAVTDGDIRRWLLAGGDFTANLGAVASRDPLSTAPEYDRDRIRSRMLALGATCVPVLDGERRVVSLLFWEDVFGEEGRPAASPPLDTPVVIMAGGAGTRMAPFTQVLPKPLLPIGEKTVIEIIIDRFRARGAQEFIITTNYKSALLKAFFQETPRDYKVSFVEEQQPLGTAGSLGLMRGRFRDPFLVTNCDIVITLDYHDLLRQHTATGNQVTMVVSLKNYRIPYGVCEIENGGRLKGISEKPEYHFLVNTGMYALSPEVLELVPPDSVFHMTDLITKTTEEGGRVGVYPIGEAAWLDTGEWSEYRETLRHFDSLLRQ